MTNGILLQNIDREELQEIVQEAVKNELKYLKVKQEEQLVTRKEAAKKLRISLVTLDKALNTGKLTGYRMNGRVLLKDADLQKALTVIPSPRYRGK